MLRLQAQCELYFGGLLWGGVFRAKELSDDERRPPSLMGSYLERSRDSGALGERSAKTKPCLASDWEISVAQKEETPF